VEPFSFASLGFELAPPFFTRFLADPEAELALRFTPEAGELDFPLVAGAID
jgi:hypothetical protein